MSDVTTRRSKEITDFDPERGLQEIAVAEAGEKHFARAKDVEGMKRAVEAKLAAQQKYIHWRDGQMGFGKEGHAFRGNQHTGGKSWRDGLPKTDPGDDVALKWRKLKTAEGFAAALDNAWRRCIRICEFETASTAVRGAEGTGEFERYTPKAYVDAARAALGGIDLDPASCDEAQTVVKAKRFYTEADDGLAKEWKGRVFLNPPYHRDLAPKFIDKLIEECEAERTVAAVLLVNNSTDTEWFVRAAAACDSICFTNGRINFWTPDGGEDVSPTQGQAFLYFGVKRDQFRKAFADIGWFAEPLR